MYHTNDDGKIKVYVTEKQLLAMERCLQEVRDDILHFRASLAEMNIHNNESSRDLLVTLNEILAELRQAGT